MSKQATTTNELKGIYLKDIMPKLQKELGIKNVMAIPKLSKIIINAGIGSNLNRTGSKDPSIFVENIGKIAGQKPVITKARKAISNFKVRENMPVGVKTTLRGDRMYDFIYKLINIVFPRVRDFRGISKKGFDGNGNFSIGFKEHLVFPEINQDDITKVHGIEVTIVTTAKDDNEGYELLKAMGFPFKEAAKKSN